MADVVKTALAGLRDPDRYICKKGVPWFRPHSIEVFNEQTGKAETIEVNEADLSEIAEHMQALESEGRAFRITNGHIEKLAKEKDQPELLGFARNARVGKFGPKEIPCVLVDEYILTDKAETIRERPYRSAEFYRQKKLITGCAALVRDPKLNLGVVMYSGKDALVLYADPVEVVPEMSSNDNNLSPEEVELFERFMKYMRSKQTQPQNNAMGSMGPMNAGMPQPVGYQESTKMSEVKKPEDQMIQYQELTRLLESEKQARAASESRLASLEKELKKGRAEKILDRLDLVEHYKLDRAEELEFFMEVDESKWEKRVNSIRKNHEKKPGREDEVPVSYSDPMALPKRSDSEVHPLADAPDHYQETMDYVRANRGVSYEEAEKIVLASRKK